MSCSGGRRACGHFSQESKDWPGTSLGFLPDSRIVPRPDAMERTLVVMVEWGLHRRLPCFGHGLRSSRCDLPAPQATQGQVPVLASLEDSEHDNTRRPLADSRLRRACGLGSSRRLHDPTRAAVQNKRSFIYDDYEHDDARGAAEWVLADASSLRHGTGRRRRWRSCPASWPLTTIRPS